MRIPIPFVILLSIAVIAGTWWYGTRHTDFLTPPTEARLAEIRAQAVSSLPMVNHQDDPLPSPPPPPPPPPPPAEEPQPAIELGDLSSPPTLRDYGDQAAKGAAHLINLAVLLETEGEFQRALLAWERVLDSGKPGNTEEISAISAIKRLRPTLPDWNANPDSAIAITLQAGTGKKTAKLLTPVLEQAARDIEHASAGILKVTAKITVGRESRQSSGPPPVALWLAGPTKEARSTEVLSFTVVNPETLAREIQKTVFQIARGHLARVTPLTPPAAVVDGEDPLLALASHITRLHWHELGTILNQPAKPKE